MIYQLMHRMHTSYLLIVLLILFITLMINSFIFYLFIVFFLYVFLFVFFFFFSSRRRHTRCSRDWSSDVCSSDLLSHLLDDYLQGCRLIAHQRMSRGRLHMRERWLFLSEAEVALGRVECRL